MLGYDVFLSYSHQDLVRARHFVELFKAQGWKVFWDRDSIPPGTTFNSFLDSSLKESACIVVLWSRAAVQSTWVQEEVLSNAAKDRLIPVLLEPLSGDDIPFGVRNLHAVDLHDWYDRKASHPNVVVLVETTRKYLEKVGRLPAPQGQPSPSPGRPSPFIRTTTSRSKASTAGVPTTSTGSQTTKDVPRRKVAPFVKVLLAAAGVVAVVSAIVGLVGMFPRAHKDPSAAAGAQMDHHVPGAETRPGNAPSTVTAKNAYPSSSGTVTNARKARAGTVRTRPSAIEAPAPERSLPPLEATSAENVAKKSRQDLFDKARVAFDLGRYQKAADAFYGLFSAYGDPTDLYNTGRCYQELHDYDRARALFERFLQSAGHASPSTQKQAREAIKKMREETALFRPDPTP